MKKIITFFSIVALLFCLTACGSSSSTESAATEDAEATEESVVGVWQYQGSGDQDPSYLVDLNLEESGDFELTIDTNTLDDTDQEAKTTLVSGTYTDDGSALDLKVAEIKDDAAVLNADVAVDSEMSLTYEISGDLESLTLTGLNNYVNGMPDTLEMVKGEQNM